jgi:arylsulfatase A
VCAPARAALLTGRYPHRTGAVDTLEMRGLDRIALREHTIADAFTAAGYATGLVGKWHNGALDPHYHPNRRGFDEFAGFLGGWSPYVDWRLDYNGAARKSDGRYITDVFTEEAVAFIRRHQREPFFLALTYSAPHFPFHALEEDLAPFRERGTLTNAVANIYGMIRRMDRGVGDVLNALAAAGLANNTIVVFTSDNGPQFTGEGEMDSRRFNCGLAGAKLHVLEGGIRVPALVRWPAGIDAGPAGRDCDALVHFTDWLPTLLAMCDIEPTPPLSTFPSTGQSSSSTPPGLHSSHLTLHSSLDGVDVAEVLRGETPSSAPPRFWQWNRYRPAAEANAAMRDGKWKLVRPAIDALLHPTPDDLRIDIQSKFNPDAFTTLTAGPMPEPASFDPLPSRLYDLDADPGEEHDLAAAHPDRVRRMESALTAWFEDVEHDRRSIDDA